MRLRTLIITVLAAAIALASAGLASAERIDGAAHGGRPLTTSLSGDQEVPGPGDPDGSGSATVTVNVGQREVCWDLHVEDIAPATAAHIHAAPAGSAGGVVVALSAPTPDATGCAEVDRALAKAILKNPADYYVNVHNAEFPPGALRGQLSK